jgi:hypothetical protein
VSAVLRIPNGFEPRPYQAEFMRRMDAGCKRAVIVWHGESSSIMLHAMIEISEAFVSRFMAKVSKVASGCWLWIAYVDKATGYGRNRAVHDTYKVDSAHRVAWIINTREPVPVDKHVLHTCDVKTCVNPNHLYLGTRKDNAQDAVRRGQYVRHNALKTHCARGHAFDDANTYTYSYSRGGKPRAHRECKMCNRIKSLAYYHRTKRLTS